MTGVDARTFQDYLCRCGSYSSYLDEAFVLVGFRQPSYFRPDLSKAACIYIGWLLTAGVLDAFRAAQDGAPTYPVYEYLAVRELQRFIDGADERQLHEVVYPVVVLGMFEVGGLRSSVCFGVCDTDTGCRWSGSAPAPSPTSLPSSVSSRLVAGCR
jgi:hypothetical protein